MAKKGGFENGTRDGTIGAMKWRTADSWNEGEMDEDMVGSSRGTPEQACSWLEGLQAVVILIVQELITREQFGVLEPFL